MKVQLGDAIDSLARIKPASVALVLSDLPSGATRAGFDKPPELEWLWPACWRAVGNGTVVFFASSLTFAATLIASAPAQFRYDLVWSKSAATGFLNARHRPLRAHEFILVFSQTKPAYNPQMLTGATPIHAARRTKESENYGRQTAPTLARAGATDRWPTSVLEFGVVGTSSRERVHPQQKPLPLLRWLVRTYSKPGDLVVDPFAGSGSTGVAALEEGRRALCFDSDPRFGGK